MRSGLTPAVATVVVLIIAIAVVANAYILVNTVLEGAQNRNVERRIDVRSISADCDKWALDVAVQNTGDTNLSTDRLYVYLDGPRYYRLEADNIRPHRVEVLEVPFFGWTSERQLSVEYNFEHTRRFDWPCDRADNSSTRMSLVAWRSGGGTHWPVYDYVNENYSFYSSDNDDLTAEDGPVKGDVVVVTGTDEYTIQTSSSSWDDRPVDSPIVLVRNPDPSQTWRFNWTDPHGTFTFHLPPVQFATEDYLVFWEDLYNPFNPRSMDDWKDHVVRFSFIPPYTYRVAVYLGKGGYKHSFFLFVDQTDPLSGDNVYNKSHGEWISNDEDGIYYEDKTYFVME